MITKTVLEIISRINRRPVEDTTLDDAQEALDRLNKMLTVKTDLISNPSLPEFVRFESVR